MFHKCWANTQHLSSKYSHRQYIKIGKSLQKTKVIGEGAVVGKSSASGLAPRWIEGWLLPGLMLFKLRKKHNWNDIKFHLMKKNLTVYPKKYAHGFCFAVLCCGYTLTDFPISIRLTSLALPAKQPWWIWINTSCEFIMNDCITTTKQRTTKPCAYFLGYTVSERPHLGAKSFEIQVTFSFHKPAPVFRVDKDMNSNKIYCHLTCQISLINHFVILY